MNFVIAALLGLVSVTEATLLEKYKLQKSSKEKTNALVHIDLQQVPYTSEHSQMALTQLPEEVTMNLAQQMGVPTTTTPYRLPRGAHHPRGEHHPSHHR